MSQNSTDTPSLATKIKWSLKRRGVLGTFRLALLKPPRRFASWLWDVSHGVDTARIVELDKLDIHSDNVTYGIRYQPTPIGAFRKMIRGLGIPYEDFNFIDFGSGKGRTLLLAAEYPFKSVMGVEFAPELHQIAQRNIRSFRGRQKCRKVQSICEDATRYRLAPASSVLYFNFPFHEPVMKVLLATIHDFLKNSSVEVIIVNYEPNPAITRLLGADPALVMVTRSREYVIYRSQSQRTGLPRL